jgi:hypothetical protein
VRRSESLAVGVARTLLALARHCNDLLVVQFISYRTYIGSIPA